MFNENPIIICGSGNSISDAFQYDLFEILKNHFTIGLNYWYKYAFEPTFTLFLDYQFYRENIKDLEKQGLIIGKFAPQLQLCNIDNTGKKVNIIKENTILLPKHTVYYGKDSWRIWDRICLNCKCEYKDDFRIPRPDKCPKCNGNQVQKWGFYSSQLVGLFSLTLAIALGFQEIYILGMDCCEYKGKTHFYQDKIIDLEKKDIDGRKIYHGIGSLKNLNGKKEYRTSTYNSVKNLNKQWYKPYIQELDKINIVNVSLPSKIEIFKKMDYPEFLEIIGKGNIDQDEIRKEIKEFIIERIKNNG